MPNWESAEDYAFTAALDKHGWAWEFLRRNSQYQQHYVEVPKLQKKYEKSRKASPLPKNSYILGSNLHIYDEEVFDPPRKGDEPVRSWMGRVISERGYPRRYSPVKWYTKKWGILQLVDPSCDLASKVEFLVGAGKPRLFELWESLSDYLMVQDSGDATVISPEQGVVVFDLTRPIPPQIEVITDELKERQKKVKAATLITRKSRILKRKWCRYLRLLDGKAAGVSHATLADVFYKQDKQDKKNKKALESDEKQSWIHPRLKQAEKMLHPEAYLKLLQ